MRITITGPRSVGKSTTAILLAEQLGHAYVSGDDIMDELLKPYGGLSKVLRDERKDIIDAHVMKTCAIALNDDDVVFDLAGGSLTIADQGIGGQVGELIKRKSIVIGLLPSVDERQSTGVLYGRERDRLHFHHVSDEDLQERVKRNYREVRSALLATTKNIIYTAVLSPEKVVARCRAFL